DLRDWAPEHEKMGKGITLTIEELRKLKVLLNDLDL
ncbi:PC4/YdbC family ssDNA-binding protein, partial [Priestia aryabhattai]